MILGNVLSLFDGISCGRLALDRSQVIYYKYYSSEIDHLAITVADDNYPTNIKLGDVVKLRRYLEAGKYTLMRLMKVSNNQETKLLCCRCIELLTEGCDLLIGGSPCQGFSFAGKQLNFDDPRSVLFFEYVKIKNILKPKYFLLENVVMKQEFRDVISDQLNALPIQINSSLLSAQMRNRLYWTNIPIDHEIVDKQIMLKDIITDGFVEKPKSWCMLESWNRFPKKTESAKGRYKRSMMPIVFISPDFDWDKGWRELNIKECEMLQTIPIGYTSSVDEKKAKGLLGNGWTIDVICHILKNLNFIEDE
jgi:DNA (cytosine-5)-methyltransferase 3A